MRSRFIDDAAEDSDRDGRAPSDDEIPPENEADRAFIDDSCVESEPEERVRISRKEKKLSRSDVRLVQENAGLRRQQVSRMERRFERSAYCDTDESDADSCSNFVVDDVDELASRIETSKKKDKKKKMLLPKPAARPRAAPAPAPAPAPAAASLEPRELESFEPCEPAAAASDVIFSVEPPPVASGPRRIPAPALAPAFRADPPARAHKPAYKVGQIKPMVVDKKIAPIFLSKGSTITDPKAWKKQASKAAAAAAFPPQPGIFVKDGRLYYRDEDGRTSPRDW